MVGLSLAPVTNAWVNFCIVNPLKDIVTIEIFGTNPVILMSSYVWKIREFITISNCLELGLFGLLLWLELLELGLFGLLLWLELLELGLFGLLLWLELVELGLFGLLLWLELLELGLFGLLLWLELLELGLFGLLLW